MRGGVGACQALQREPVPQPADPTNQK